MRGEVYMSLGIARVGERRRQWWWLLCELRARDRTTAWC